MYKYLLTLRYLKMRFLFILSVLGVAVGVMVLMITTSVMSGFLVEIQKLIRGIHADLEYLPESRSLPFSQLEEKIKKVDSRILAVSPHLQREVLLCTEEEKWSGGILVGIDYALEVQTTNFKQFIHTPYKQIWEEIHSLLREGQFFRWEAIGAEQKGRVPYLYIRRVPLGSENVLEKEQIRLGFNDANQVQDYSLVADLPAELAPLSSQMEEWLAQQNQYLEKKQTEFVMKSFSSDVTLNGRGLDLNNPFTQTDTPYPPILVGESLLQELKLSLGDPNILTLMTAQEVEQNGETQVQEYEQKFVIIGSFKSGLYEIDSKYLYAPIQDVQKFLFKLPFRYSSAYIKVKHQHDEELQNVVSKLEQLPETFYIKTWKERKRNLLRVVSLQKNVVSIILFFIVIMATTTILFILLQLVFERKQDIGILKSMGATPFGISSIFCLYGMTIAFLGILLGLTSGYLILDHVNQISQFIYEQFGKEIFPRNIYHLNEIPTDIQLGDIFLLIFPTVIVSILFSIPAAYLAARQDPVATLQAA